MRWALGVMGIGALGTKLLHLLWPARRPVRITPDLRQFWNTGYPQVKKELKGRYPKHPRPGDSWNAVPTRKTKRW